jgi:hypothetical protein
LKKAEDCILWCARPISCGHSLHYNLPRYESTTPTGGNIIQHSLWVDCIHKKLSGIDREYNSLLPGMGRIQNWSLRAGAGPEWGHGRSLSLSPGTMGRAQSWVALPSWEWGLPPRAKAAVEQLSAAWWKQKHIWPPWRIW